MAEIIKPNGGHPKKIVNMHNEPIDVAAMETKDKIVQGLRKLADELEAGNLKDPEYVLVVPTLKDGSVIPMLMGEPMPHTMLVGVLSKLLARMALQ